MTLKQGQHHQTGYESVAPKPSNKSDKLEIPRLEKVQENPVFTFLVKPDNTPLSPVNTHERQK